MGTIMAVVAALEMNIETMAVVNMKPNMAILGEVPIMRTILRAILRWRPLCSTQAANMRPPSIMKLVARM